MRKRVCVVGLGYIGLPTAAMFATHGHDVIGVDTNRKVIDALNKGEIVIEEPSLDALVKTAVSSGHLTGSIEPTAAEVFIIAVPTPITQDRKADMSFVVAATESIRPYLSKGSIVVLESTSPTGTIRDIVIPILEKTGLRAGTDFFVAYCPERVLPGRILIELVENSRIIGGVNGCSAELVKNLYESFVKGAIYVTDATTAEMCKMMENTYRDVNIALANELARICEQEGINVWEVVSLCNKHPRVNLHQPGPGVGGHCLAVDPWFIVEKSKGLAQIIELSRKTNDSMPHYVVQLTDSILQRFQGPGPRKVVVLGGTYKPDIDDTRESPALEIVDLLAQQGYEVVLVDPHIKHHPRLEQDILSAAKGSDLLLLAVHHREFARIEFSRLRLMMRNPIILDTRNFWDGNALGQMGFEYHLLGCSAFELPESAREVAASRQ